MITSDNPSRRDLLIQLYDKNLISYNSFKNWLEADMLVEFYSKAFKRPKWTVSVTGTWDDVIEKLEGYINDPDLCTYKDNIEYISIKGTDIKYYKVNIFIKNLTKKVTLIPLKERPE